MSGFKVVESQLGKIGNDVVRILNLSSEDLEKSVDFPSGVHFISIFDRSGSMAYSLHSLIQHIKAVARNLREGDYYSVFWYSGSNQIGCIVKGMQITGDESALKLLDQLLDKADHTLGCTVFSQVLGEIKQLIEDTCDTCSGVAVNFFTDGQLVPDHQTREEERRQTLQLTKAICANPKVLAFDTIGYGSYYDRELLTTMAAMSKFGVFNHSYNIDEYLSYMTTSIETIKGTVPSQFEVVLHGKGIEAMYLSDKGTFHATESFKLSAMSKKDNKLVVFYPEGCSDASYSVELTSGEEVIYTSNFGSKCQTTQQKTVTKVLYGIGSKLYQLGRRDDAFDLFAGMLKDKPIYKMMQKAFSVIEVGDMITHMHKAYVDPAFRHPGTLTENVELKTSFVRLVEELALYNEVLLDIRQIQKGYRRVGAKAVETGNHFEEDYNAELLVPIEGISFHKERLNLYVTCSIPGFINIKPEDADPVGLEHKVETVRYKTYNIVFDGMLNIKELPLVMKNREEYKRLVDFLAAGEYGTINTLQNDAEECWKVTIPMEGLAIADRSFAKRFSKFQDGTSSSLAELVLANTLLEMRQKSLGYLIDTFDEAVKGIVKTEEQRAYTVAQLKVLEAYGLDSKLRYQGVNRSKDASECDYIYARNLAVSVKGLVNTPPVAEVLTKTVKIGTAAYQLKQILAKLFKEFPFITPFILESNDPNVIATHENLIKKVKPSQLNTLREALSETKKALRLVRTEIGLAKFVKGCTATWFTDLPLEEDKSKYEVGIGTTVLGDNTIVTVGTTYTKLVVTNSLKDDLQDA